MAAREIPEAWRVLMSRKGFNSIRSMAMKADMSHVTINRLVFGDPYYTSEENIQRIADVLGVDYSVIYRLAGRNANYAEPWTPPANAARMTQEQRAMVERLITMLRVSCGPCGSPGAG